MRAFSFVIASGALACAAGASRPAEAQLVGTATLESQYVYRGLSLDEREPDLRLGFSYDRPSGGYVGAAVIAGLTPHQGVRPLGYLTYLGYARRGGEGVTWDVGVTNSEFTEYVTDHVIGPPASTRMYRYRIPYREGYVGLSAAEWSARLYLSPNYLRQGDGAAYLDVTRTIGMSPILNGYVHAGLLSPFGGSSQPGADRERFDVGAGVGREFRHARLRLGWTHAAPAEQYPPGHRQKADQVVVGLSGFF